MTLSGRKHQSIPGKPYSRARKRTTGRLLWMQAGPPNQKAMPGPTYTLLLLHFTMIKLLILLCAGGRVHDWCQLQAALAGEAELLQLHRLA